MNLEELTALKDDLEEKIAFLRKKLVAEADPVNEFKLIKVIEESEEQLKDVVQQIENYNLSEDKTESSGLNSDTSRFQAYHSFTCDRAEQMKFFNAIYKDQLLERIQFYYIYGLDLQGHTGMFQRISYHLEDLLTDYLDPLFQKKTNVLRVQISSIDVDNDLAIYKENVLKKLFRSFSIDVNIHNDLLKKNLSFIVENSPQVKGLTAQDYVCIFLGITDRDWDKDQTPIMAHWFIKEFCEVELPADSPKFLFFFGIMYEDNDSEVKKEVVEVMQNPLLAKPLPELAMVNDTHIKDWFDEYAKFFPKVRDRKNIINTTLQNLEEYKEDDGFFMEDIQDELEKIIDQVNEELIRK